MKLFYSGGFVKNNCKFYNSESCDNPSKVSYDSSLLKLIWMYGLHIRFVIKLSYSLLFTVIISFCYGFFAYFYERSSTSF